MERCEPQSMNLEQYLPASVLRRFEDNAAIDGKRGWFEEIGEDAVFFADVSGFIGLTERYTALEGTKGNAMLAQIMSISFSRLSTAVLQCGGDVVRFTTDSVIAKWSDQLHGSAATRRAVRCALAIQHADHFLELKIGIGKGSTSFVHLHSRNETIRMDYVLTGAAMKQAIAAESIARPKEVVCAAEAWMDIKAQFEFTTVHGSYFRVLRSLDPINLEQPTPATTPSLAHDSVDTLFQLNPYLPTQIAQTLGHGHVSSEWISELRRVTVLYMELGVRNAVDANQSERIQTSFQVVQDIVCRLGGSVNKIYCDAHGLTALIVFGLFPMAHSNDPTRALVAAARIASALHERLGACTKAGITTGLNYCGVVGEASGRKEYTVVGDRVNVAARLLREELAKPTKWIVTIDLATKAQSADLATYSFVRSGFESEEVFTCENYEDCSPALLKSRVHSLTSKENSHSRTGLGRLRVAGAIDGTPEETARRIRYALDDSAFQFFLIQGDSGSGKTHLLRLINNQILTSSTPREQPTRVICTAGDPLDHHQPCAEWVQIVRQIMQMERARVTHNARPLTPLEVAIAMESPQIDITSGEQEAMLLCWLSASGSNLVSHAWALNDLFGINFPRPDEGEQTRHLGEREDVAHLLERARMSLFADILAGISECIDYRIVCLVDDANYMGFMSWMVTLCVQDLPNVFVILSSCPLNRRMVLKGFICEKIYETYSNLLQLPTTYLKEIEPLTRPELSAIVKSEINVLTIPEVCADWKKFTDGVMDFVETQSAGNPFIAKQIVAHMVNTGSLFVDRNTLTCYSPSFTPTCTTQPTPSPLKASNNMHGTSKRGRQGFGSMNGSSNLKSYMSSRLRKKAADDNQETCVSPHTTVLAFLAQRIDALSFLQQLILKVAAHDEDSSFHRGTVLEALPLKGYSLSYLNKCFEDIARLGLVDALDADAHCTRYTFAYPLMRDLLRSRVVHNQKSKIERRLANAKLDLLEGRLVRNPIEIRSIRFPDPKSTKTHAWSAKKTFPLRFVKHMKFGKPRKRSFRA